MLSLIKKGGTSLTSIILLLILSHTSFAATVGFRALIGSNTEGCSVIAPERTLNFSALKARNLTGGVTTHEILPLQVVFFCQDADGPVTPSLTVTGNTPYSGTADTVFLDGAVNGVGFMVRRSDGSTPPLSDFYNTGQAVANNDAPMVLTTLDSGNNYYNEEIFLVGVVGPLGGTVVPGPFSATLIVNVLYQ